MNSIKIFKDIEIVSFAMIRYLMDCKRWFHGGLWNDCMSGIWRRIAEKTNGCKTKRIQSKNEFTEQRVV